LDRAEQIHDTDFNNFTVCPEFKVYANGRVIHTDSGIQCPLLIDVKGYVWTIIKTPELLSSTCTPTNGNLDVIPLSRLLALSFHGAPEGSQNRAAFIDGNRCHANANNICWKTSAETFEGIRYHSKGAIKLPLESPQFLKEYCQSQNLEVPQTLEIKRGWLAGFIIQVKQIQRSDGLDKQIMDQKYVIPPEGFMQIVHYNPRWTHSQRLALPSDTLQLPDLLQPIEIGNSRNYKRNSSSKPTKRHKPE